MTEAVAVVLTGTGVDSSMSVRTGCSTTHSRRRRRADSSGNKRKRNSETWRVGAHRWKE